MTLESQLFTVEDEADFIDSLGVSFFQVTLTRQIGKYPAGTTFDSALLNYERGILEFYDREGTLIDSFHLTLGIKEDETK